MKSPSAKRKRDSAKPQEMVCPNSANERDVHLDDFMFFSPSRGANAFGDHVDGAVGGKGGTFLPGQKVAAVVAGKIDTVVWFDERLVGAFVILAAGAGDPGALAERYLFPDDIHRVGQIFAVAGMKPFDCGAGGRELRFDTRQFVEGRNALHSITGQQHAVLIVEIPAGIPNHIDRSVEEP